MARIPTKSQEYLLIFISFERLKLKGKELYFFKLRLWKISVKFHHPALFSRIYMPSSPHNFIFGRKKEYNPPESADFWPPNNLRIF
jgi:hypothetical protein